MAITSTLFFNEQAMLPAAVLTMIRLNLFVQPGVSQIDIEKGTGCFGEGSLFRYQGSFQYGALRVYFVMQPFA